MLAFVLLIYNMAMLSKCFIYTCMALGTEVLYKYNMLAFVVLIYNMAMLSKYFIYTCMTLWTEVLYKYNMFSSDWIIPQPMTISMDLE